MNYNVKITRNFVRALWKIDKDQLVFEPTIQELRLFGYVFENWNDKYTITVALKELHRNAFKYTDESGKVRKLISNTQSLKVLLNNFYKRYGSIIKLSVQDDIITFVFENDIFYINGLKKSDWKKNIMKAKRIRTEEEFNRVTIYPEEAYVDYVYASINSKVWNEVRLSKSIIVWKLFFFILYEKMRGPFKTIRIDLDELYDLLMINWKKEYRRMLKSKAIGSLNHLKDMGFISDFRIVSNELIIDKYNKNKK